MVSDPCILLCEGKGTNAATRALAPQETAAEVSNMVATVCPSREILLQYSLGFLSGGSRTPWIVIWTAVATARRRS